jgi:hypothetical protein
VIDYSVIKGIGIGKLKVNNSAVQTLLQKSTLDIIIIIIVIAFALVFMFTVLFILLKIFRIQISLKNFKLLSQNNGNKNNEVTQTLIENFLIQLSLVWKNTLHEIEKYSGEKYYLKYIAEKKRQMSHVERTLNIVFAQIRTEFYTLKKNYRVQKLGWKEEVAKKNLADQDLYHFESVVEGLQSEIKSYFRNIFEQNGLEDLKTDSNGTKNSEFEEYIKSHQYNIIDIVIKYVNTRCNLMEEPDITTIYDFLKTNFFKKFETAIEDCIITARFIHLNILRKIQEYDSISEEILNHSIRTTLETEIDQLITDKKNKEKK